MKMTIPCMLILLVSIANAQTRAPLQISVVEQPSGDLVGNAEVAIYAPNGLCIRRGQTGLFGHPYTPEAVEPLDPKLQQLRVVVRKRRGYTVATESVTLAFENKAWRAKEQPRQPPTPARERITQIAQRTQPTQLPSLPDFDTQTAPVEVWLRLAPIPVCRSAPWQTFVCGCVPYAPPGPPCGPLPPIPPSEAWIPSSLPPSDLVGATALETAIRRQAAIVELGRPPAPEFEWAAFGSRWVNGPHGMFWQARVIPQESKMPDARKTQQEGETGRRR